MSYIMFNKNSFAALGDDTEIDTLNVTLLSESYPTLSESIEPKTNISDTIIIMDENEWTFTKTKKTHDVVIEIIPIQHEDELLIKDENELFERMTEKFMKYASVIDANINESKVQFTRFYTIAVIMLCHIISHLNDIKTKNSIFSRTVIRGLMSVGPNKVNVIQLIYTYLEFCNEYYKEDFADSTFNAYYGKRKIKNFDKSYHLTHGEINLTIGDCETRFVTLLKILRTSIAWIIYNATNSYIPPTEEPDNIENWSYSIKTEDGNLMYKFSDKFVNFILDIAVVHEEFDKMEKELTCINEIFVLAKKNVSSFTERKNMIRNYQDKNKKLNIQTGIRNNHSDNHKVTKRSISHHLINDTNNVTNSTPIRDTSHKHVPISAPITWSSTNPATRLFVSDKKPDVTFDDASVSITDKYGGLTGKARQEYRRLKHIEKSHIDKPLTGNAKKNERARQHKLKQSS